MGEKLMKTEMMKTDQSGINEAVENGINFYMKNNNLQMMIEWVTVFQKMEKAINQLNEDIKDLEYYK